VFLLFINFFCFRIFTIFRFWFFSHFLKIFRDWALCIKTFIIKSFICWNLL